MALGACLAGYVAGYVQVCPPAQGRVFGCDQAAPDAVLADVPVPQRECQALGSYLAGRADGDRSGCLLASLACLGTYREPLVGIEVTVSAPGVPDDPGPRGLIGERDGDQLIRLPHGGPLEGAGGRLRILRRGGARNSHLVAISSGRGCRRL